jgi:hypothetical protein
MVRGEGTSMKRLIVCILSFVVGLTGGSTIRFTQHWKAGYRQGYLMAITEYQREAVREGHGHWERRENFNEFSWNQIRPAYEPDEHSYIPGLE